VHSYWSIYFHCVVWFWGKLKYFQTDFKLFWKGFEIKNNKTKQKKKKEKGKNSSFSPSPQPSFPMAQLLPSARLSFSFLSLPPGVHLSAHCFSSSSQPWPNGTQEQIPNHRDFAGLSQVNTLYSFAISPATPFLLRRTPSWALALPLPFFGSLRTRGQSASVNLVFRGVRARVSCCRGLWSPCEAAGSFSIVYGASSDSLTDAEPAGRVPAAILRRQPCPRPSYARFRPWWARIDLLSVSMVSVLSLTHRALEGPLAHCILTCVGHKLTKRSVWSPALCKFSFQFSRLLVHLI